MNVTSRTDAGLAVAAVTKAGGSGANEDAFVANAAAAVYGVVDGVSALEKRIGEGNRTAGEIAARILAEAMEAGTPDLDLRETVLRANAELRATMEAAGVDLDNKARLWGAVFAIFRVRERTIEYVQSGDCMLFARHADGSVRVLTRNRVASLDLITLDLKRELAERGGLDAEEIRSRLRRQSMANRERANRPDGYSVMNGDPELEHEMEHGAISRSDIRRLYAVTDGIFHFIENSDDPLKWNRLLDELDELGLERYIGKLVEEEDLDPDCAKYPRHKKSDDKTAIVVELSRDRNERE